MELKFEFESIQRKNEPHEFEHLKVVDRGKFHRTQPEENFPREVKA